MQTLHPFAFAFASAFLAVALVACADPSSSNADAMEDVQSAEAEVTVANVSFVGRAKDQLRADLRAALGKSVSATEEASVAGVLRVRPDVFSDELVFDGTTWDLDTSLDGTLDFVFPSAFDGPEVRADGPARKLYEAMTSFTTKRTLTIVGSNMTHTSPGGLVACTAVSSVHFRGDHYECRIKGVEGISRTRGAR